MKLEYFQQLLSHYLACMIWTEEERLIEEGMEEGTSVIDLPSEVKIQSLTDLGKFVGLAGDAIDGIDPDQLGHDIWLTRNGHGAGFFDRGYDQVIEDRLTAAAKSLGEVHVYLGDDKKLYI